ncbi:MAG: hypothetical protein GWP59_08560, partial [Chlamydiales bacterium]|nr:hypothetical protein [Chlamydiales bacterium]
STQRILDTYDKFQEEQKLQKTLSAVVIDKGSVISTLDLDSRDVLEERSHEYESLVSSYETLLSEDSFSSIADPSKEEIANKGKAIALRILKIRKKRLSKDVAMDVLCERSISRWSQLVEDYENADILADQNRATLELARFYYNEPALEEDDEKLTRFNTILSNLDKWKTEEENAKKEAKANGTAFKSKRISLEELGFYKIFSEFPQREASEEEASLVNNYKALIASNKSLKNTIEALSKAKKLHSLPSLVRGEISLDRYEESLSERSAIITRIKELLSPEDKVKGIHSEVMWTSLVDRINDAQDENIDKKAAIDLAIHEKSADRVRVAQEKLSQLKVTSKGIIPYIGKMREEFSSFIEAAEAHEAFADKDKILKVPLIFKALIDQSTAAASKADSPPSSPSSTASSAALKEEIVVDHGASVIAFFEHFESISASIRENFPRLKIKDNSQIAYGLADIATLYLNLLHEKLSGEISKDKMVYYDDLIESIESLCSNDSIENQQRLIRSYLMFVRADMPGALIAGDHFPASICLHTLLEEDHMRSHSLFTNPSEVKAWQAFLEESSKSAATKVFKETLLEEDEETLNLSYTDHEGNDRRISIDEGKFFDHLNLAFKLSQSYSDEHHRLSGDPRLSLLLKEAANNIRESVANLSLATREGDIDRKQALREAVIDFAKILAIKESTPLDASDFAIALRELSDSVDRLKKQRHRNLAAQSFERHLSLTDSYDSPTSLAHPEDLSARKDKTPEALSRSLFAHLLCDGEISGTAYESNHIANTRGLLKDLSGQIRDKETFIKGVDYQDEELGSVDSMLSSIHVYGESLKADLESGAIYTALTECLNRGKPFYFEGGYSGLDSGHAMLYRIQKEGDKLSFSIFNSGEGVGYHGSKADRKSLLMMKLGEMSLDSIFELSGDDGAQEISGVKDTFKQFFASVVRKKEADKRHNIDSLYGEIINTLSVEFSAKPMEADSNLGFMTTQKDGVCSMHVFRPTICKEFSEKQTYKSFMSEIRCQMLFKTYKEKIISATGEDGENIASLDSDALKNTLSWVKIEQSALKKLSTRILKAYLKEKSKDPGQ